MTLIAIDFGTSNTVVSLLEADTGMPKTLRLAGISRLFQRTNAAGELYDIPVVPTLVFVKSPTAWVLGEPVRSQRLGLAQPDRLFKAFKRDLAIDFQPSPRQLDGASYSAEYVSEKFIQSIWQQILQQGIHPSQVVFTVPVGAFERYLDWFRGVADRLQVDAQLVDESTAAALGYAVDRPGSLVLVIDFGGGTLDLSLVRTQTATGDTPIVKADVLAKSDAYLGGEDIDRWIVEDYLQQLGASRATIGEVGWQNLLAIAERLKMRLSAVASAQESWLDETTFMAYELVLDRPHLEAILEARQLLEQLRQALDEVLAIALSKGIRKADIEQVMLVGGSCLIPAVQQLILSYFGKQRVKLTKPFEAVAHGALALGRVSQLQDYLRHSYAIRLWEPYNQTYSYLSLFDAGMTYPCQRSEPITLQVATDRQTEIRLDIGEVANVTQAEVIYDDQGRMTSTTLHHQDAYRSLDITNAQVCVAHLDPPGQVGVDRVTVAFAVTEQRMLIATVRDLLTEQVLVAGEAIAKLQ
jgi:molecular chaperone DnaK (HSP70)